MNTSKNSNYSQGRGHQGRANRGRDRQQSNAEGPGHDTALSRSLSKLLRHDAPKENVKIYPGGYLDVEEVLRIPKFSRWTEENIRKVVEANDKQRFSLQNDAFGKLQICANQGHSFEIDDVNLERITSSEDYPTVIHGTYLKNWDSIKKSGLKRMNRVHIHFAPGEPGESGVISGMRTSAQVYIYVNLSKALQDGIKFYRSKNNVILSPGNEDGVLETKYFAKVKNARSHEVLNL